MVQEIVDARAAGTSINGIARDLTERGVPTARGGVRWHASTVKAVLESQDAAQLAGT